MADVFGEDIFAVFEGDGSPDKSKKDSKGKKDSSKVSEAAEKVAAGEKREFKSDVVGIDLDDVLSKKAKPEDSERLVGLFSTAGIRSL